MVKNEHQLQSMPWEAQHHSQQQLDYYMNLPGSSYTNVNLIINNTNNANRISCNGTSSATMDVKMSSLSTGTSAQTVPSSAPKSRSATGKNSSSSSHADDFPSSHPPPAQHKEIYPWMSDKKHGSNKSKNSSKNPAGHNTTSTSSSSSSSGKTPVLADEPTNRLTCEDENRQV